MNNDWPLPGLAVPGLHPRPGREREQHKTELEQRAPPAQICATSANEQLRSEREHVHRPRWPAHPSSPRPLRGTTAALRPEPVLLLERRVCEPCREDEELGFAIGVVVD
jgi:hypothetical protein